MSFGRYDSKRVYLLFILSFCVFTWFNSSKWTTPKIEIPKCLSIDVNTGTGDLSLDEQTQYLFVITPTYHRLTQMPDMLRLKQSLLLYNKVVWIVIEDSSCRHQEIYTSIKDFPHLIYINQKLHDAPSGYNKGAEQRNFAINLLKAHFSHLENSVVYFADDDNTYNSQMLPRLMDTKRISVFNVGLVNEDVEGPIADQNGNFVGWRTRYFGRYFNKERKYCIDMAGFAVQLKFLLDSKALFDPQGIRGYLENDFLEMFPIEMSDLEVLTKNKSEIVAWHTKTSYMIANHTILAYVIRAIKTAFYFCIAYVLVVFTLHRLKLM